MPNNQPQGYDVSLNVDTKFILSTSGSQSSIERHNQALKKLSLDLVYFTFSRNIDSKTYADLFRAPIIRGGAVTGQGLKSGIVPFLDTLDPLAKEIGAVNTVINNNGQLTGYNTDAFGFEAAISPHIKSSGLDIKTAVIYGNGGVSGVAAFVLKKMGLKTTMTGRNPGHVHDKMQQLHIDSFSGPYDLFINATPVSSEDLNKATGLLDTINGSKMVFDHNMPEKDNKENFLEQYCKQNNTHFIPGKEMYVPQMIKQWQLFLDGVSEQDIIHAWNL